MKVYQYLLVVTLVFLVGSYASAEFVDKRKFLLDPQTVTINKIRILDSETEILGKLGKPQKIEIGFSEVMGVEDKYLIYPGMKIYVIEGKIFNLRCDGEECITDKNIAIGSTSEDVIQAYGQGRSYRENERLKFIKYPLRNLDAYLKFHFENGKVTQIEYFVDYV